MSGQRSHSAFSLQPADGCFVSGHTSKPRRPRWSPDGSRIIFSSNRDGRYAIYSANPDGSKLQRLIYSDDSDFFFPVLSPDEKHLVVFGGRIFDSKILMRMGARMSILTITLDATHTTKVLDEGMAPTVFWGKN